MLMAYLADLASFEPPGSKPATKRIPEVCRALGLPYEDLMMSFSGFRRIRTWTSHRWRSHLDMKPGLLLHTDGCEVT